MDLDQDRQPSQRVPAAMLNHIRLVGLLDGTVSLGPESPALMNQLLGQPPVPDDQTSEVGNHSIPQSDGARWLMFGGCGKLSLDGVAGPGVLLMSHEAPQKALQQLVDERLSDRSSEDGIQRRVCMMNP